MTHFLENIQAMLTYTPNQPMLFNSGSFLVLFIVFYGVYLFTKNYRVWRLAYVTAFSLFFYYKSSGEYVVLLAFCIVFNYLLGRWLSTLQHRRARFLWMWLGILVNLSFLLYFKYTYFLLGNYYAMIGESVSMWSIFLPIGISFFTFQTISYLVDVKKGSIDACRNVLDFGFYLSFFPQLVAGPIVRAKDFLPQIRQEITVTRAMAGMGLFMILKGLAKKAIIADYVAQYADLVYGNPTGYSGFEHLMAMYAYTLQIYCDFSGYSDMAIGLALLMGFTLPENFRSPYQALTITDFWRRWHISLSSWLRDYVYIAQGGNRRGPFLRYVFLFTTMLIGGFWHGASWKFVFWGAMHGVGLIAHKVWLKYTKHLRVPYAVSAVLSGLLTFHFVAALWVFFRAESFEIAADSLQRIVLDTDWAFIAAFWQAHPLLIVLLIIGFGIHFTAQKDKAAMAEYFTTLPVLAKILVFLVVIQIALQMQSADVQPFIYFQF